MHVFGCCKHIDKTKNNIHCNKKKKYPKKKNYLYFGFQNDQNFDTQIKAEKKNQRL